MSLTATEKEELLYELWLEQDRKCYYCGIKIQLKHCELDHKVPVSRGGSDTKKNMVAACHNCNKEKGNKTVAEYRRYLQEAYGEHPKF